MAIPATKCEIKKKKIVCITPSGKKSSYTKLKTWAVDYTSRGGVLRGNLDTMNKYSCSVVDNKIVCFGGNGNCEIDPDSKVVGKVMVFPSMVSVPEDPWCPSLK